MHSVTGRMALLGVPIDNLTMDEAVALVEEYIQAGGFHQIATANVDFLMRAIQDEELMDILHRCSAVVSDGMPLVWASKMLRTPLKARVNGTNLLVRLAQLSDEKHYKMFLLGASESRSKGAAEWIERNYPGAQVERYSPPLAPYEAMNHEEILARIEAHAPDILVVAFGNPKQEKWIAMHRDRLKVPVCIGIGGSLDFLSGDYSRAPVWMQDSGLEWLHRISQEPGRLGRRYASNATGLARHLSVQLLVNFAQPQGAPGSLAPQRRVDETSVYTVGGCFRGDVVVDFDRLLGDRPAGSVIVDLHATEQIGADALGSLARLAEQQRNEHAELWLVGVRPGIRKVLRATFLDRRFLFAADISEAIANNNVIKPQNLTHVGV